MGRINTDSGRYLIFFRRGDRRSPLKLKEFSFLASLRMAEKVE